MLGFVSEGAFNAAASLQNLAGTSRVKQKNSISEEIECKGR